VPQQESFQHLKVSVYCFNKKFIKIHKSFFFLDLEQSYLGSDLVLNHPSSVSTLYFQVATFQKRATLTESPPIPTTQPPYNPATPQPSNPTTQRPISHSKVAAFQSRIFRNSTLRDLSSHSPPSRRTRGSPQCLFFQDDSSSKID
jgi:hypothetical protein